MTTYDSHNKKSTGPSVERTPIQILNTPVEAMRGVGPARARLLAKMEIHTVLDMLFQFPRDYEDLSDQRPIGQLEEDLVQTIRGEVVDIESRSGGFGKSRLGVLVFDGQDYVRGSWFNQPFLQKRFSLGQQVMFSAKPKQKGPRWEMSHPRVTWLDTEEGQDGLINELLPVYPLTEGISQYYMRKMIGSGVEDYATVLEEAFPENLLAEYNLLSLEVALKAIHLPDSQEQLAAARYRFIFQELFVLQLALAMRRWQQQISFRATPLLASAKIDARIRRLFPFELTADQDKTIQQVAEDMELDRPMNRLIQGDVGSGKTIIALYALLLCVAHGHQAVMMVPTEILARQHMLTIAKMLENASVRTALLTGGMSVPERRLLLKQIANGDIDVVIGTHAVVQEDVKFRNLALAVIDEQHKFGVKQRAALRRDEHSPHYLVMTATPIPRTVSMTLFGDLDVSIIREMPVGRQPIKTYVVEESGRKKWWKFVRDKLDEGRQAFVVAPLVEESEHLEVASVSEIYEQLTNGELAAYRVGLLHGRMSSAEKDDIMKQYREGELQVLVSTTVIEVGVDIPNASVMTIDSAERFGLAQLHQLRGRVGRGKYPGACAVMAAEELTDQARERLEEFAATTDGFELAEIDFKMRGPGDLFGTQQHGLPPFRIADLIRDAKIVEEARTAAQKLMKEDPGIVDKKHARLRRQVRVRYGKALNLGDVG